MTRFFCVLALSGAVFFSVSSPTDAQQFVYPKGIGPANILSGIYRGTDAGNCCWVGSSAVLRVEIPTGADTLLLNVYLPDFAVKGGAQSLRVQINQGRVEQRCCLGAGEHEVTIKLPLAGHPGPFTVHIWPARTFVPKELGLNEDPRHLSVMLRDVGFLDSVTGERLDQAALPALPARAAIPILLVCGVAALMLTLRRPLYGLLALVATDPFLFAYSIHGTTITLPKVALISVAIGLAPRLAGLARTRPLRALYVLAGAQLLFIATMVPGSLHSLHVDAAVRETLKAVEYLATIVVAYCAYRLDPNEKSLRIAFAFLTIVVTVMAFAQLALPARESEVIAGHYFTRIAGPLEGPNQLSGFLGVVIPAMLAFVVLRKPLGIEWIAIALGTLACVLTFSRGGVVALVLAVAVLLAVRYLPKRRVLVGYCVAALFGVELGLAFGVFSGALRGGFQSLFGSTGEGAFNGGLGSRVDLWHGAYALWRGSPVFGIGAGNYELEVGRYYPGARTHANGIFFQTLAEQGVAGLVAVLVVTAASVGTFLRRLDEPLVLGACMAGVAMSFHQIIDCMWLYPKVGVIWWVLLASAASVVDQFAENR